jgi:hypothetical protein
MTLTRRDAILRSVVAAVASAGASGYPTALFAQADLTVDDFLHFSERLTGASGLDLDVAKTLLGGFVATGHGSALADLARLDSAPDSALADAVVAAWYSGLFDTGHGPAVSDFNGALVWNALSFTKPFGNCGGEIGYWSNPPEP